MRRIGFKFIKARPSIRPDPQSARWLTTLAATLCFLTTVPAFGAESLMVGVLEEPQCAKEKDVRARIMFSQDGTRWVPLHFPNQSANEQIVAHEWTVAFDGRSLGALSLTDVLAKSPRPSSGWYYARDQLFAPSGQIPSVANTQKLFGGWCEAPHSRPLVLVSKPNVGDPAGWKPFVPGPEFKQQLFAPLRLVLGRANVINCRDPYENKGMPYLFGADDLTIYKGYRSSTDGMLVSIGLDIKRYQCDGPSDSVWSAHWFLIRSGQVDSIGGGMQLVDAGDYDGDGKSDLLFWTSGYNHDGYVLFFDDLRQKVEYTWSYH